jgi:hypothetical protein
VFGISICIRLRRTPSTFANYHFGTPVLDRR